MLAADDNAVNRLVLTALLESMGIEAVVVADGAQVIEAWQNGIWDVVLMDIHMPVLDGVAATREIRRLEKAEGRDHTPVIALTADAMSHHRGQYLDQGMDDLVAKPIAVSALISAIQKAVVGTVAKKAA